MRAVGGINYCDISDDDDNGDNQAIHLDMLFYRYVFAELAAPCDAYEMFVS